MNKLNTILLILVLGLCIGCTNPANRIISTDIGDVARLGTEAPKSLYLSKIQIDSDGKSFGKNAFQRDISADSIKTLSFLNSVGLNTPIVFITNSGQEVVLNVTSLKKITNSFIAISFDTVIEVEIIEDGVVTSVQQEPRNGKALIDMSSGAIYDITGYDIDNCLVKDNILYIRNSNTLFKISLDSINTAIPLNNPTFNPAGPLKFILNNKVISGATSFDINGVIPPKSIQAVLIYEGTMTGVGESFSSAVAVHDWNDGLLFDNVGDLWGYRFNSGATKTKIGKYKLSIDDAGKTIVTDYSEITLSYSLSGPGGTSHTFRLNGSTEYDADHILLMSTGYVLVEKEPISGISFENGSLNFSGIDFPAFYQYPIFYNYSMYWNTSNFNKIMCMDIMANNLFQFYSNPNLLNSPSSGVEGQLKMLELTDDKLLFYQYITVSEIGTYSLKIGDTDPILVSTNKADVESIVELDF